jgi:hypothetical protein
MTKHVRIENADTSNYKVCVEVWNKDWEDPDDRSKDVLEKTIELNHPTAMATEYLTTRYFIVKEKWAIIV